MKKVELIDQARQIASIVSDRKNVSFFYQRGMFRITVVQFLYYPEFLNITF